MRRLFLHTAFFVAIAVPSLMAAPQAAATSAARPASSVVLNAAEAGKLLPSAVFFQGQSAPVQTRNSAGIRFGKDSFLLAALVDNSGYSSQVQQKYQAYLITEEAVVIGGHRLGPGAYGCGFVAGDKFVVMDIGGHDLFSASSAKDATMHRPVPLQIVSAPEGNHRFRLYGGRTFVEIALTER